MRMVKARRAITKTYFPEPSVNDFTLTKAAFESPR